MTFYSFSEFQNSLLAGLELVVELADSACHYVVPAGEFVWLA